MTRKNILRFLILLITFSSASTAIAQPNSSAAKSKAQSSTSTTLREVVTFESEPKDGSQIRVSKSNGFVTNVKVNEKFQLVVIGMLPQVAVASVVVSPKGLSTNLPAITANSSGEAVLPYMSITKQGTYSVLVRQPERNKSIYIQVKVK